MKFYASLSVNRSQIRKTFAYLLEHHNSIEPLRNIIVTPIARTESVLDEVHKITEEHDLNLMYDSGGYEVQTGNVEFDALYDFLLEYYDAHQTAHRYVLPDNVPTSDDSPEGVQHKVTETLSASRTCYKRLPPEVQDRAIGVVQGHDREQISRCLNTYAEIGLDHVGFGSFGTSGDNNGVNMLTTEALNNLKWTVDRAADHGFTVHAFGVGGPTSIPLLEEAGVDSFDTSSWMRSSGFGNVFFPFKSRYNASHRTVRSGNVLIADQLADLKQETNHECYYCKKIERLRESRWARIIHNLIVTYEMTERVSSMDRSQMVAAMDESSVYRSRLQAL
jgi:tRNA-guanine family transglycosylase